MPGATDPAAGGDTDLALAVTRDGDTWLVGPEVPAVWRLAVWGGLGATLWWDVDPQTPHFGVIVTDASAAAPWIGEVCGGPLAAMLAAGVEGPDIPIATDTVYFRAAHDAALARWRQAWWPASREKLVPPLDPRLVAAELADALRVLEPIASDAPTRVALEQLAAAERRFGALQRTTVEKLHLPAGADSAAPIFSSAVPAGPPLAPVPTSVASETVDHALHPAPDRTRAPLSGTVAVDLSRLPNGVVDAAAEAWWHIEFRGAVPHIVLEVLAAPRFANAAPLEPDLHASFADVAVKLTFDGDRWWAEQPVPLGLLTSPPSDRTLVIYVPSSQASPVRADAGELIRIARERLIAPTSLSEHDAAAREIR